MPLGSSPLPCVADFLPAGVRPRGGGDTMAHGDSQEYSRLIPNVRELPAFLMSGEVLVTTQERSTQTQHGNTWMPTTPQQCSRLHAQACGGASLTPQPPTRVAFTTRSSRACYLKESKHAMLSIFFIQQCYLLSTHMHKITNNSQSGNMSHSRSVHKQVGHADLGVLCEELRIQPIERAD